MLKNIASPRLYLVSALALATFGQLVLATDQDLVSFPPKNDHYVLHDACAMVLNEQISSELYASILYMNIAGYFGRPSVARYGYAKFFKDQSQEEYNHATQFIDYINKRNGTVKRIAIEVSPKSFWSSPKEALADAINLEKHVYAKLRHIHDVADQKCEDRHLQDYLESNFFTEQVDSIKELQAMYTLLNVNDPSAATVIEHLENDKMKKTHDEL